MHRTRKPESEIKVFELGHYESMQIDMALAIIVEVADEKPGTNRPQPWDELDVNVVRQMRALFAGNATITLIRKELPL